jgi:hypothetical protein
MFHTEIIFQNSITNKVFVYFFYFFCILDHAFSNYDEIKPTKCIFKINHIFSISVLLLHVSALYERHLQGAQRILMKLCGVPEGVLNLSSTKLPRPWSPWKPSPSRKNPHGRTGNRTRDFMISSQKQRPLETRLVIFDPRNVQPVASPYAY